ncbi:MAG TPA: glycosyltransferase family 9 protein, partial [Usitatibacter sp.]|nr:glycosyltransferase family 9 protein [Usitatibacter sp.]
MASAPGKVLVMELAGLGDNVHLLPALWELRDHWPATELHVMVNAHVAALFGLAPWVDRTWAYPRPRPSLASSLDWTRRLRAERFDCVINTTGSDRSSLITRGTGAPMRIGRRPADGGPPGWAWLFTQVVDEPHYREPMYLQKRNFMATALLGPGRRFAGEPRFHVAIDPALRRAAGITAADEGKYIHLSPCTTAA